MASTLFLSGHVTMLADGNGEFRRAPCLLTRKGTLRADAAERLEALEPQGDVVACLPFWATTCQTLNVSAHIGRQVSHTDLSDAIEAAVSRAGGDDLAMISADAARVQLDGKEAEGSAVGQPAQTLEVDVCAFVSALSFLTSLEQTCRKVGLELQGVISPEEAVAAALDLEPEDDRPPLILFDRWHTKVMSFHGSQPAASVSVDLGPGHLADDLAVTFNLSAEKAEETARRVLMGKAHHEEATMVPVVTARLAELASSLATALKGSPVKADGARLVGLPVTAMVTEAFEAEGLATEPADMSLTRMDPAIAALAEAARGLADGAVARTQATALQLRAGQKAKGPIDWLRRNF